MLGEHIKLALGSIRAAKWRSFLTTLGIVIGVVSVVLTVSLGEGLRQQVAGELKQSGNDLITVRPGIVGSQGASQSVLSNLSIASGPAGTTLTDQDIATITTTPHVRTTVPYSFVTAVPAIGQRTLLKGAVIASTSNLPRVAHLPIAYGEFFAADEMDRNVSVIGQKVAEELLQENVPVGQSITLRGEDFIVRGVLDALPSNPLAAGIDYNYAVIIPYTAAKRLNKGNAPIYQVVAQPDSPNNADGVAMALRERLNSIRGGQADFRVLKQSEVLDEANRSLNLIIQLIGGIAAISLLVGGIGIMNIMLMSVSERTHEIGIRKAIGATNRQVLGQFLIEAIVLSVTGGVIGVVLAVIANYLLRILTDLQPVISVPIMAIAILVALVVGMIFGVTPALRAARKDPIDSLRFE